MFYCAANFFHFLCASVVLRVLIFSCFALHKFKSENECMYTQCDHTHNNNNDNNDNNNNNIHINRIITK